ncbi:MAG: D-alanine--D-alanine ligase [Gammaproteobacteria bacterium]|nr:D-alanine--D-alanine ligase [Gammaproteobacteria bacterium]MDH4253501.1 D-alanine--D-alanine ligase [Gammaproteobacteria bacterium]MDH5309734.1 D-alanine--D-alanine ligase [Gammaproteobacteria bacterium]
MDTVRDTILVLHESMGADIRPDEQDTLAQVDHVTSVLDALGYDVDVLAADLDLGALRAAVRGRRPDCVFNLVESLGGDGRLIHLAPAVLESIGQPFTGCGSQAMFLTTHKQLAKHWMRAHGVPTPASFGPGEATADAGGTWIVKSLCEHASFGMDDGCVVDGTVEAERRLEHCRRVHGGDWFAEQYVDGREFNVAVLEADGRPNILPMAEMTFVGYPAGKPRIVGYAAKWDESAPEYRATRRVFPELPGPEREALEGVVMDCWRIFGLRGYARVDIRMDAAGVPWVLEVNANPCLSPDAGFAAAADRAGLTAEHIVSQLLREAKG